MVENRRIVQVDVSSELAELVADVLWRGDPSAVSVEDGTDGLVRLTADVADVRPLEDLPTGALVHTVELDDDAHLDAWRAWAKPVRAGRRVVLHPAWLPVAEVAPDDLTVIIDPGRAFGLGSHATTRSVIAVLEDRLPSDAHVLDVGTGSGVLAITACLLGAASALAIDIDAVALDVAARNADRNGVGDRIIVSAIALTQVEGTFDIVLANIGAQVLGDLADALAARAAPGGLLVLAGLLVDQADGVVACYPAFDEVERLTEDGWSTAVLCAPT